jgi:hypothetical protein
MTTFNVKLQISANDFWTIQVVAENQKQAWIKAEQQVNGMVVSIKAI